MESTKLRTLASAGFVIVLFLSACSDNGEPADSETPVSDGMAGETPMPDDHNGADTQEGDPTEPGASHADAQRIGGETIGFTVELPHEWLNVPTDQDMIDTFAEQEDLPDDVAVSMRRVVQDGLDEESLLAYGGTEDDVDIFLIASCEPDDGGRDATEVAGATVDGAPAARSSNRDSHGHRVWLNYRFPAGDEVCWVRFPAPDESWFARFDDIVATIDVL